MSLTMNEIIAQADLLVDNTFSTAQKALWLNEVNQKFFEVVKIPKSHSFTTIGGTATYVLTNDLRGRNIDQVQVGTGHYPSFLYRDTQPGTNYHLFDDTTFTLTLAVTPTQVLPAIIRYFAIATTTYTTTNLTETPDAPSEYHFVYVFGLAQKMAEAREDIAKANNFGGSFHSNLLIAQQNFLKQSGVGT